MGYDFLIIIAILTLFSPINSHAYTNVSLGWSLYAGQEDDNNSPWRSPSGDFAFGFLPQQDQFILAIWFDNVPEKTIVWSVDGKNLVVKDSKLELVAATGLLRLTSPTGVLVWNSSSSSAASLSPLYAAMLDNGNFIVVGSNGNSIWESFRYPTDTILPGQILKTGDLLWARKSETDYSPGRFELRLLSNGSLVMNQIYTYTTNPYDAFYEISNVSQMGFNDSGYVYLQMLNGSLTGILTPVSASNSDLFFRATLNFDGTFTLYSHLKSKTVIGNASWIPLKTVPDNICLAFAVYYGSGPCGFNSYCQLGEYGRPVCGCAPGFSLLNPKNNYGGCKMDFKDFGQDCNEVGSVVNEDFYHFRNLTGVDWPLTAYEKLSPSSQHDCEKSCLRDCYCAVAIFQPPDNLTDGACWKKRLPLSNGRFDPTGSINRTALFKLPKSNSFSSGNLPGLNSLSDKDIKGTVILSAFLVTSVIFNFFSIAAIFVAAFFLYSKKHLHLKDPDTNLRSFSYGELALATDGFKEELGKGAFGTVYKGVLDSSSFSGTHIAVKKLEKIVQEGEKEFKTEVNVIGQTHHKNLVRLIGYCQEGENRLLVYEFMKRGSVSSFLFKPTIKPSWKHRVQISFGIARGLMYLHEECNTQIIHCDIKSQNILLDDTLTAKISDFGLAKLLMNNQSRTLTGIRGTRGYVAPEWFKNIPITVKVDVYSFGVVLLEIICCKRNLTMKDEESVILSDWAFECLSDGRLGEFVDWDEDATTDAVMLERMVMVGLWCLQEEPGIRPSMKEVSLMLEGIMGVSVPPCPYSSSTNSFSSYQQMCSL